jgi:hypothetical protein
MKAEVRRQEAEGIKLILKAFCHLRMVGLFPPNCTSCDEKLTLEQESQF